MLNGNGIESLKMAKRMRNQIKVFVLINSPFPQLRDNCLEEGADYSFDRIKGVEDILELLNSWPAAIISWLPCIAEPLSIVRR